MVAEHSSVDGGVGGEKGGDDACPCLNPSHSSGARPFQRDAANAGRAPALA